MASTRAPPHVSRARRAPFFVFLAVISAAAVWAQLHIGSLATTFLQYRVFFELGLAATVVATLRHVVGFRTFGTFASIIVAISFVASGPVIGFALYGLVLAVVLIGRAAVAGERIQEAHRVAILVILVGLAVTGAGLAGLYLRQPDFTFAFLFPVLITAWIAERFVEQRSRLGWGPPLKTLGSTTVAIALAYGVIAQTWLVLLVVRNPVSWVGLVLLNWLLGTKFRFRLSERWRFRPSLAPSSPIPPDDVLTMTVRNREYIARYNPPAVLATLDKVRAKAVLAAEGIPVPRTYGLVQSRVQVRDLAALLPAVQSFALKPASGYGGEGIILVRGRNGSRFLVNGSSVTLEQLLARAWSIANGDYSDGLRDTVIVEELLEQDPALAPLCPEGVADVRILCFLGFPVMAMARLPTRRSKGRANLHSGAVGVGLDLATGRLRTGVHRGRWIHAHPDTGARFSNFAIPRWPDVLEIAVEAQRASGLGFAGVDVVLDRRYGPVVMEVNRRPGLEIQNANRSGLLRRLRAIERLPHVDRDPRTAIGMAARFEAGGWGRVPASVSGPSIGVPARTA